MSRAGYVRRGGCPHRRGALALLLVIPWLACQSTPPTAGGGDQPPETAAPPDAPAEPPAFSGRRAFEDLDRLAGIGPRVSGTRGARRARSLLRRRLEQMGAEVVQHSIETPSPAREGEPVVLVSMIGVLPGESSDVLMLAAPYDTAPIEGVDFVGANDGASGAALVLELGRALARRPRPYTIWLAFVDGDGQGAGEPGPGGLGPSPAQLHPGSDALARKLAQGDELERVRVAIFFNRVGDADLTIERDLRSNQAYREIFWQSARDLDRSEIFVDRPGYVSVSAGHLAFADNGLRQTVAIADERYGPGEPPGLYWHSEQDVPRNCSSASLDAVGNVALEALDRIAARLVQIDRFTSSPLAGGAAGSEEAPSSADPAGPDASSSGALPVSPEEPADDVAPPAVPEPFGP